MHEITMVMFCWFKTEKKKNPNSLPNENILDWTKLKAVAEQKSHVAEMMISISGRKHCG